MASDDDGAITAAMVGGAVLDGLVQCGELCGAALCGEVQTLRGSEIQLYPLTWAVLSSSDRTSIGVAGVDGATGMGASADACTGICATGDTCDCCGKCNNGELKPPRIGTTPSNDESGD